MRPSPTTSGNGTATVRVTREDPVYRPDAGQDDPHFFRDLANLVVHRDPRVYERLRRHNLALGGGEVRDSGSGAYGGIVVPQYLTGMAVGPVRAGDPLVKALDILDLPPDGMTFTVPRSATTGGAVAASVTSENTAVAETDPAIVNNEKPVVTVAGRVTVSSQYINRGTSVTEVYLTRDLQEAVDTAIDSQLINGTGLNGQLRGLLSVTDRTAVTSISSSRGGFSMFVGRTAHDFSNNRLKPPDTLILHPRRFYWMSAGTVSETPSITRPWCMHHEEDPFVAYFANMDIVLDSNIPTTNGSGTNEDVAILIRRADMPLHLGPLNVTASRAPEAGSLEVDVTAWRYAVWFPDRYRGTSTAVLSGTGLVAPGSFTS